MTVGTIVLAVAFLIPISASAQQSADCVGIYDDDDKRIGRAHAGEQWYVFFDVGGPAVMMPVNNNGLRRSHIYFSGANCTSAEWVGSGLSAGQVSFDGTTLFYPDPDAADSLVNYQSRLDLSNNQCLPDPDSAILAPALQVPIVAYTPPFHLQTEACNSAAVAALGPRGLLGMPLLLGFGALLLIRRPQPA